MEEDLNGFFVFKKSMAKKGQKLTEEERLKCVPQNQVRLTKPPVSDYSLITQSVAEISKLGFDGNIIPHTWYNHIVRKFAKYEKPYLEAIIILSDICYWYRATPIREEESGKITGYKKKFKYNRLQKSYKDYVKLFGLSEGMVKSAFDFLEKEGYIYREFVNYQPNKQSHISNQMYIEPIVSRIVDISFPKQNIDIDHITAKLDSGTIQSWDVPLPKVGNTYTEITNTYITNRDNRSFIDLENSDQLQDQSLDHSSKNALFAGEEASPNTFGICLSPSLGSAERNTCSGESEKVATMEPSNQTVSDASYEALAKKFEKFKHTTKRPKALYFRPAQFDLDNAASMSEVENLKWLNEHREYQLENGKWGYETEKPTLCEFIFEAQMNDIPIEYAKRTYELWVERGWTFKEDGNAIEHWVGALKYCYRLRKTEKEEIKAAKVQCTCGYKYIPPVLYDDDYDPDNLPKCPTCGSVLKYTQAEWNNC